VIIRRQFGEQVGQQHGLLTATGTLAGRTLDGDQPPIDGPRGLIEVAFQRPLQTDVAGLGAIVAAHQVTQATGEDLPQPGGQLRLRRALEAAEMPGRLQEGFLDHVGAVGLALEPPANL